MSAELTRLLMRICASRLDPSVSGVQFVDLLEELVDLATPQRQQLRQTKPHTEPPEEPPPVRNGAGGRPRWRRPDRAKIDYDERVRIRARAEAEKGNSSQYPPGFVLGLAAQYDVSEQTIRNILKGD